MRLNMPALVEYLDQSILGVGGRVFISNDRAAFIATLPLSEWRRILVKRRTFH